MSCERRLTRAQAVTIAFASSLGCFSGLVPLFFTPNTVSHPVKMAALGLMLSLVAVQFTLFLRLSKPRARN